MQTAALASRKNANSYSFHVKCFYKKAILCFKIIKKSMKQDIRAGSTETKISKKRNTRAQIYSFIN